MVARIHLKKWVMSNSSLPCRFLLWDADINQEMGPADMSILDQTHIDKTRINITNIRDGDQQNDWENKSPTERLAGLEILRQMWHDYDPSTARLSRVYSIVERKSR
jgi:hypothetical protein